ncbi:hypothetical protein QOZ80_8BG0650750 [Eleusine coracana subsp. coracana]|nr:hypothetical protein QOZ80_8BG0650750 [Eleusine coracana subsp. coracana]
MACCFGLPSSSRRPRITDLETTTSTCTAEAVTRRHLFVIKGYSSLLNHVGATCFVRSDPFEAGGFNWAVRYYPAGDSSAKPGFVSAFIELLTRGRAEAKASGTLSLVPWSGCAQRPVSWHTGTVLFRDADHGYACGWSSLMKRRKVEAPGYLSDDSLRIECTVTVFQQPWNSGTRPLTSMAPAAAARVTAGRDGDELDRYLAMLLDPKEGAPFTDVMFQVGPDATFRAHRLVLWMRCRRLFDRTKDSRLVFIPEPEVKPDVFRILLDYVYRESLPAMDDLDAGEKTEMLKRLLVAAKLYGVDMLKRVCERTLAG